MDRGSESKGIGSDMQCYGGLVVPAGVAGQSGWADTDLAQARAVRDTLWLFPSRVAVVRLRTPSCTRPVGHCLARWLSGLPLPSRNLQSHRLRQYQAMTPLS